MESFEDAPLLPFYEEPSSPIPQRKLKRLRKASGPRVSDPPIAPTLDPDPSYHSASEDLPDAREVPDLEGSAADAVDPAPASEDLGKGMASDDELDPLFPDPRDASKSWQPRDMEEGEEAEEWWGGSSWGGESGRIGMGGIMDDLRKERSAKKRLNLEGEEDITEKKKKKKKKKSGELAGQEGRPEESIREKRRLEKERMANLEQIHAESQRLLRETRDASFKPVPLVQKPISSVLEKIRLRKLEVSKKPSVLYHSDSIADTDCSAAEMSHVSDLSGSNNGKENNETSKMDDAVQAMDGDSSASFLSCHENVTYSKASDAHLEDSFQIPNNDTQNVSKDSKQSNREKNQFDDGADDTIDVLSPSLPASSSKPDPADVSSSSEEDNDKENIDPHPHKAAVMDSYPEGVPAKAFLDDEAEEEDDSDHDLTRFPEDEEDDESDENEVFDDLIASGFEEAPIDHEKRNQLHQKWLEQQDAAATDNVLQRLKYGKYQKEPTVLDEEDDEELGEDSEDKASYDLPPANFVRNNSKKAKQMIAQMFTDDHDAYVPSDDEETEQTLIRQCLSKQMEESSFVSPVEDEHSREVFGLIKKLNIAPDSKKRGKTATSNFNMLMMGGNSNSSSKSSFLGRATSSSLPSSHKQGSTTVRTFIFSRDDTNSRSGISTTDNLSDMDQAENEPKHTSSSKFRGSQLKPASSRTKVEGNGSSGSSLFEILRQSSTIFDKQLENKRGSSSHVITETQAAYQFSAFKLGKRFPKVEARN
ncbi:midasin isoform X2 [Phoenix dactylifera]|uniref:Midasin isoform X2 n=1 Tax=Phoenix dactylifera TaxID=42345 RepID=A0A8B8ZCB3_PHODC|nr:midasin isoform X2 [Phoenix dactylifera]